MPAAKLQGDESGSRPSIQCFNYQPRNMQSAGARSLEVPISYLHRKATVYSCCAQICVQTLGGKQGYFVSIIIDTSTLAHNLIR